jgi:hypothetical protein
MLSYSDKEDIRQQGFDEDELKISKRGADKTHQRTSGHDNSAIFTAGKHAWISTYHKNTQRIRSILWTQHNLPNAWLT